MWQLLNIKPFCSNETFRKLSFFGKIILIYNVSRFRIFRKTFTDVKLINGHYVFVKDLNDNSLVIDLGASNGIFSAEITKLYNNTCYAIEPNVELYKNLNQENIISLNYAISNSDGPIDFYISNNYEASSILNDFENIWKSEKKITVQGITFKSLLDILKIDNKKIDLLKVDIEGAELDLIESLTNNEVKNIKQITIEFHDWLNKNLYDRTVGAITKLISLGFTGYTYGSLYQHPVEMFFLNKKLIDFNIKQKVFLRICKSVPYPILRKFSPQED